MVDNRMDSYMCMFPQRTLVEVDALYSYIDMAPHEGSSYDMPPNDFFEKYFRYKKLVDRSIAKLYPNSNKNESNGIESIFNAGCIIPIDNVAYVTNRDNFMQIALQQDIFYLALPWLYNANIDDYMEICNKYPDEYENLVNTIEKIGLAGNKQFSINDSVLKDLKDSLVNIQIAFDKKKNSLKSKGIITALGISLTCIPFVYPELFKMFNPDLFKTVIGSSSLLGSKDLINTFL